MCPTAAARTAPSRRPGRTHTGHFHETYRQEQESGTTEGERKSIEKDVGRVRLRKEEEIGKKKKKPGLVLRENNFNLKDKACALED